MAQRRAAAGRGLCPYCQRDCDLRGLNRHTRACALNPANVRHPEHVNGPDPQLQAFINAENEISEFL